MHFIISPGPKGLPTFMKAFTCRSEEAVQRKLGKAYFCWEEGFFEDSLRDSKGLSAAIVYVQHAVMDHGLVREIMNWPWTSLRHTSILDSLVFKHQLG
jgi:hypothetical protein